MENKKSRLRDSPSAAGRFCDIIPIPPQCDPPDGFVVRETKFPVQQKITRSILFPLDRVTNEFPVISLSTPSTFLDYEC